MEPRRPGLKLKEANKKYHIKRICSNLEHEDAQVPPLREYSINGGFHE
jgi:hypothetical protein